MSLVYWEIIRDQPLNPLNPSSSMPPFQHASMQSFIFFSFFKHIKREKFNIIIHIIWCHYLLRNYPCYHIASVTRPIAPHRAPSRPIAPHRNTRQPCHPLQPAPMHSFILYRSSNTSNERNSHHKCSHYLLRIHTCYELSYRLW